MKNLAKSLELIAEHGPDAFYKGAIADQIAEEMQKNGGLITKADLAEYKAVEREPIHGSYPQAAGKNIANPMATILSAAMLLEHVGLEKEGKTVREAVNRAIESGVVTEDLVGDGGKAYSTTAVGDFIAAAV